MHNVFGIRIGVAISFLVERHNATGSRIHYERRPEFEAREEKLTVLHTAALYKAAPDLIRPDAHSNRIDLNTSDSIGLLPLVAKAAQGAKSRATLQEYFP